MFRARRILISRTDAIGDVVLTLPLASLLKERFPHAHIGFLGKLYTKPVINACSSVDEFVDLDWFLSCSPREIKSAWDAIIHVFPRREIAFKALNAGIPIRIGTSSRPYHWLTCNALVRLSRKNSNLHEAELNTLLLSAFDIKVPIEKEVLGRLFAFDKIPDLPENFRQLLDHGKKHIILHPTSQGSAREWGLSNFATLIDLLPQDEFQVFVSGTEKDHEKLTPLLMAAGSRVIDISGQMDLSTYIAFIARCDALVAASTGPLHIAAALGRLAIGIYPSIRPMHPGRWAPLGPNAIALQNVAECTLCRSAPTVCSCIQHILPVTVSKLLQNHRVL